MDLSSPNLNACTLVPEVNSSYLYDTHYSGHDPLSGSTMGLMMLLSSLQYQAPYIPGPYQQAAQQAGHSAYIMVGGQAAEDQTNAVIGKVGKQVGDQALNTVHSMGIGDAELGAGYIAYKIVSDKKINVDAIKVGKVRFNLTIDQQSCSFGVNYGW